MRAAWGSLPPTGAGDDAPQMSAAAGDKRWFVGRESEMGALLSAVDDAMSGRGKLLLLGGQPGIGKTRLADEFAAKAESAGARVLWGRCWEAGGAPAYWPWIQSLRGLVRDLGPEPLKALTTRGGRELAQLLPELRERLPDLPPPDPASPEVARFRLFDTLTGFLRSASEAEPLVMIMEDLHAADASLPAPAAVRGRRAGRHQAARGRDLSRPGAHA
ncbi:MAG TPA: ATP-binding protein [Egibacteraceae bacterium]|nr:ATP-binding protein [Egibacteraceae bacterium]